MGTLHRNLLLLRTAFVPWPAAASRRAEPGPRDCGHHAQGKGANVCTVHMDGAAPLSAI